MTRFSTSYIFVSALWILLGWFHVQVWGFRILPAEFGIFLGMLVGGGFALRTLRIMDEMGEYRTSRREWIAELAVIGGVFFLTVWLVGLEDTSAFKSVGQAIDSLARATDSLAPALFGTRGVLFLAWEIRNGNHILSEGFVPPRLYAVHKNSAY